MKFKDFLLEIMQVDTKDYSDEEKEVFNIQGRAMVEKLKEDGYNVDYKDYDTYSHKFYINLYVDAKYSRHPDYPDTIVVSDIENARKKIFEKIEEYKEGTKNREETLKKLGL